MKRFFLKLSLFLLAPVLALAFPAYALWRAGEFVVPQQVPPSGAKEVLYGKAYSSDIKFYKLNNTLEKKPQILVLGNSRGTEIRSEFFKDGTKFYNARLAL